MCPLLTCLSIGNLVVAINGKVHCGIYEFIGYIYVCVCVCLCLLPPSPQPAPLWNETAEKKWGVLADEDNTLPQNSSSNTSHSNVMQKEITLPSRLVYYINQDSESPYHVLDTKARHQQKHNKVGRALGMQKWLPQRVTFDLMFRQNLISHILLKRFIRQSMNITIGQKLEGLNLGCPGRGLFFLFSGSKLELEFSQWPHKCSS